MRLHDVQVLLSGTNTVDKIHNQNIQHGQNNQIQNAITINNEAEARLKQTNKSENESASSMIDEEKRRQKKGNKSKNSNESKKVSEVLEQPKIDLPPTDSGNIIDIKI